MLRPAPGEVPSSIELDHGDVLVMEGPAQSEYEHRTVSGRQGPRVNLTFRWVTQHIASCALAGAVGCTLPSCVQGFAEPGPRLSSLSSVPASEGIEIRQGCRFIGSLVRALGKLPGGFYVILAGISDLMA